jgi:plastocyanin
MPNLREISRHRRLIAVLCGGAGLAALAVATVPAIGAGGVAALAAAAHTSTVEIANFTFAPKDLTVTAGTTVTWKNADDSPHRIADVNGAYTSAALDTEESFSHTFAAPGVYKYFCSIHPYMVGTIFVK